MSSNQLRLRGLTLRCSSREVTIQSASFNSLQVQADTALWRGVHSPACHKGLPVINHIQHDRCGLLYTCYHADAIISILDRSCRPTCFGHGRRKVYESSRFEMMDQRQLNYDPNFKFQDNKPYRLLASLFRNPFGY